MCVCEDVSCFGHQTAPPNSRKQELFLLELYLNKLRNISH